jgi:hypothetical protein
MHEGERKYKVLVESQKERPLRRPRCRWNDNINMYHREVGLDIVDGLIWIRMGTSGGLM